MSMVRVLKIQPTREDEYGKASRAAMLVYADYIAPTNNELAKYLRTKVIEIENSLGNITK